MGHLEADLVRRTDQNAVMVRAEQPACGSTARGSYNTTLHVLALVLILVLSTLACSFPILARRFPRLPIPRRFLFISRHFGTGVLIATAFVHLLPTAFVSLTDPCLPRFWNKGYPAMAGLVAMLAVFLVVSVEMFFAMKGAKHLHANEYDNIIGEIGGGGEDGANEYPYSTANSPSMELLAGARAHGDLPTTAREGETESENLIDGTNSKYTGNLSEVKDSDDSVLTEVDPYGAESHVQDGQHAHFHFRPESHQRSMNNQWRSESDILFQSQQRQLIQCLLLEAGILFHSIFIGMALSVATGTSFIVLLVAISFHQTFEGFALGARIAPLIPDPFPSSSWKPWLMACAYGTTTPMGQAIGLVLHNLYDPASATGLLMVGLTNAISSGLLLFAGLVELLAEDFLSDSSYKTLRGTRRIEACISVATGAMLMAFVGAFA